MFGFVCVGHTIKSVFVVLVFFVVFLLFLVVFLFMLVFIDKFQYSEIIDRSSSVSNGNYHIP